MSQEDVACKDCVHFDNLMYTGREGYCEICEKVVYEEDSCENWERIYCKNCVHFDGSLYVAGFGYCEVCEEMVHGEHGCEDCERICKGRWGDGYI